MATNEKPATRRQPETTSPAKVVNKFAPGSVGAERSNGKRGLTVELVAAVRVGGAQTMFGGAEDGGSHIGSGERGSGMTIELRATATATVGGEASSSNGTSTVFSGAEDGGSHIGSAEQGGGVMQALPTPTDEGSNGPQGENDDWPGSSVSARRSTGVKSGKGKK